jgi:hypothetical protein
MILQELFAKYSETTGLGALREDFPQGILGESSAASRGLKAASEAVWKR